MIISQGRARIHYHSSTALMARMKDVSSETESLSLKRLPRVDIVTSFANELGGEAKWVRQTPGSAGKRSTVDRCRGLLSRVVGRLAVRDETGSDAGAAFSNEGHDVLRTLKNRSIDFKP